MTRGSCDVESITRMILQKTEEGELCYVEEVGEEEKHDEEDEEEEGAHMYNGQKALSDRQTPATSCF